MANTLRLFRRGAVGFIDWLDFRALLRDEFIIKFALAVYHLPAANRTSFYVTTEDVNLAFPYAAVVTGLPICSPVLFLISIANAVEFLASDAEGRLNRVVHHGLINLTSKRSATAGEGERGLQWICFHKMKRCIRAAGGWLDRLVRCIAWFHRTCDERDSSTVDVARRVAVIWPYCSRESE